MLPLMSNVKRNLIAGTVALALVATSAAPALAWGQREQDFTKGALAVLLLGAIARDVDHHNRVNRQPVYQQPTYQQPTYYQPREREYQPRERDYQPRDYQQPIQSVYATPVGQAFLSYSDNERRRIQATLANYGYYRGNVDGNFGPGTYQAITAYASQSGKVAQLETRGGSYGLLDGLLY